MKALRKWWDTWWIGDGYVRCVHLSHGYGWRCRRGALYDYFCKKHNEH